MTTAKLLTRKEKQIVKLGRIVQRVDDEFASDLVRRYRMTGHLSDKQWYWVNKLLTAHAPKKRIADDYYLYAISDGECVKLGMSNDPATRKKELQTAQPRQLKILWKKESGGYQRAKTKEKMLHKHCRQYHIRGEWFTPEVLPLLESFKA